MDDVFDAVVVGAGPSALGFASSVKSAGKKILLVESGKSLSDRNDSIPEELASGVGGAGIFIDGKLSFFPAGTALWQFPYKFLSAAFAEMLSIMTCYFDKVAHPNMPSYEEIVRYFFFSDFSWQLKRYDSYYMDQTNRFAYLHRLIALAMQNCTLLCNTTVVDLNLVENGFFRVSLRGSQQWSEEKIVFCKKIVFAGGRFLPLQKLLRNLTPQESCQSERFRRHEFGIRLQVPHNNTAVTEMGSCGVLDPKFVKDGGSSAKSKKEIRTFCFCRQGVVCESNINGLRTYSGRADVEPTQLTNFGLMVRTTDESEFNSQQIAFFCRSTFQIEIGSSSRDQIRDLLLFHCGAEIGAFIWHGLQELVAKFPSLWCAELKLFGPCLEGVGKYPNVVENLQIKGIPNAYAIGDASGIFRGLVPSILSGNLLAHLLSVDAPLLVSTNKEKAYEISATYGPVNVISLPLNVSRRVENFGKISFGQGSIDIPAFHACNSIDHVQAAIAKAQLTRNEYLLQSNATSTSLSTSILAKDLLVSSTALEIDFLHGFPGVFVSQFFAKVGAQRIYDIVGNSGATFESVLVRINVQTGVCRTAVGRCRGKIVSPRGSFGFGWDSIFVPDHQPDVPANSKQGLLSFAEMNPIAKKKISAHALAVCELQKCDE